VVASFHSLSLVKPLSFGSVLVMVKPAWKSILVMTGVCTVLLGSVNAVGSSTPVLTAQQATSRTPQTITGRLDQNSAVLEAVGSYYATHTFEGTAGETIQIELSSDDFDAYLILLDPDGEGRGIDDGAGGVNSLIVTTLPTTGTYTIAIVVKTYGADGPGQYRVAWRTASDGDQDLAVANQLNQQAIDLYNSGRYNEAIPLAERALVIREAQLEADHPDTASSLNNLAVLYESMGRYGEAEPLFQRALAIQEAQLEADHPATASSLNSLALLYESMGRYGEAEPLFQRALAINEAQLGADHPATASSLNSLALLYESMGRYGEAEPLFQRALANQQPLYSNSVVARGWLQGSQYQAAGKLNLVALKGGSSTHVFGHLPDGERLTLKLNHKAISVWLNIFPGRINRLQIAGDLADLAERIDPLNRAVAAVEGDDGADQWAVRCLFARCPC